MGMKTKFKHKVEQITEDQLADLNSDYRIATTEDKLSNERQIELLERKRI